MSDPPAAHGGPPRSPRPSRPPTGGPAAFQAPPTAAAPTPRPRDPLRPRPGAPGRDAGGSEEVLPPEVAEAAADPARCLGRIVLLETLGRGAKGIVRRAYDLALRREVAVKSLVNPDLARPGELQRFAQEARAIARLRHPGIVAVHEVGEGPGGTPYLVMDYVQGTTLEAALVAGPLPPRRAAELARDLARALAHAHEHQIVHRDVKPANILLDAAGRSHLTDFGLAREDRGDPGITEDGAFLGTPGYAPPEQIGGHLVEIGPRSDLYALGAVLYHALAGRPPFEGDGAVDVVMKSLRVDPTPVRRINPDVHADLETIALRCLEKAPDRRYQSADDLAEDLRRFLDAEPILARPLGWGARAGRWVRRHRLAAAGIAVGGLLAVSGLTAAALLVTRAQAVAIAAEREAALAAVRLEARERRAAFDAACAERLADVRTDPEERARQFDARLGRGLDALATALRLATLAPDDAPARRDAYATAMALGTVALEAEQWNVAVAAYERAASLGVDDASARSARDEVQRIRGRALERIRREVTSVIADVRAGRFDYAGGFDDALFILASYRSSQAVRCCAEALEGINEALRDARDQAYRTAARPTADERRAGAHPIDGIEAALERLWELRPGETLEPTDRAAIDAAGERILRRDLRTVEKRDNARVGGLRRLLAHAQESALGVDELRLARLLCVTLGRIGLRDARAIDALAAHLAIEEDPLRAASAGVALCRIGGERARALANAARLRFGESSAYWSKVALVLILTERSGDEGAADGVETAAGADPTDLDGWIERSFRELARGRFRAARAALREASELAGDDAEAWARIAGGFHEARRPSEVIPAATRAIELDPGQVRAWLVRGRARVQIADAESRDAALADCDHGVEMAPGLAEAWSARGSVRVGRGELEEGERDLTRAIELDPSIARTWVNRGTARRGLGRLEDAEADLSRAIELDRSFAPAWRERAIARRIRGDLDGALGDATRAIDLDPTEAVTWTTRANVRLDRGELATALDDYDRAIEIDGSPANTHHGRGRTLQALGQFEDALVAFGDAVRRAPENGSYLADRSQAKVALGRHDEALSDLEAASLQATGVERTVIHNRRGILLKQLGRLEEAVTAFDRAIAADGRNATAWSNRGTARRQLGDLEGALADTSRAIELEPSGAGHWQNRANVRFSAGDLDGAIADYDEALARNPRFASSYHGRANAHLRKQAFDRALSDLGRALELDPRLTAAWWGRGRIRQSLGDREAALADFQRVVEIDPKHLDGWRSLAEIRLAGRDLVGAERAVERVLTLDPDDAEGRALRGAIRTNQGRFGEAIEDFSGAVARSPLHEKAWAGRAIARQMNGDLDGAIEDMRHHLELFPDRKTSEPFRRLLEQMERSRR